MSMLWKTQGPNTCLCTSISLYLQLANMVYNVYGDVNDDSTNFNVCIWRQMPRIIQSIHTQWKWFNGAPVLPNICNNPMKWAFNQLPKAYPKCCERVSARVCVCVCMCMRREMEFVSKMACVLSIWMEVGKINLQTHTHYIVEHAIEQSTVKILVNWSVHNNISFPIFGCNSHLTFC